MQIKCFVSQLRRQSQRADRRLLVPALFLLPLWGSCTCALVNLVPLTALGWSGRGAVAAVILRGLVARYLRGAGQSVRGGRRKAACRCGRRQDRPSRAGMKRIEERVRG
jgi:hypothetical protein